MLPRERPGSSSRRRQGGRSADAAAGSLDQAEPGVDRSRPRHVSDDEQPDFEGKNAGDESGGEIFVNVGRKDGAKPSDFQGILEDQGFELDEIDYVRVRQRHTFVGVSEELLRRALNALDGAEIAGRKAMAERARPRGN